MNNSCRECGQPSIVADARGPICPDCVDAGYAELEQPHSPEDEQQVPTAGQRLFKAAKEAQDIVKLTDPLKSFVRLFRSGAQGCEMDYEAAQSLAQAIEDQAAEIAKRDQWMAELEAQSIVKPLVWDKFEHDPTEQEYVSLTLVGKYFIGFGMTKGKRYVEYNGVALGDEKGVFWFDYLKDAKAAAQADFERRIKSALEPAPIATQEADADLDERMKAAGMIPLSELLESHGPMEKWMRHADVHTFDDFCLWVKMKQREFMTMRMKYELGDRDKDDDLFEWVFAHAAVFDGIATQLRALAEPDKGAQ